jgi:hypothetical protein
MTPYYAENKSHPIVAEDSTSRMLQQLNQDRKISVSDEKLQETILARIEAAAEKKIQKNKKHGK